VQRGTFARDCVPCRGAWLSKHNIARDNGAMAEPHPERGGKGRKKSRRLAFVVDDGLIAWAIMWTTMYRIRRYLRYVISIFESFDNHGRAADSPFASPVPEESDRSSLFLIFQSADPVIAIISATTDTLQYAYACSRRERLISGIVGRLSLASLPRARARH